MARRIKQNQALEEQLADALEIKGGGPGFFERYQNYIMYAAIGLIAVFGIYILYKNIYLGPREKEAVEQMALAQAQFEKDSFALALTNPGGGFSGFLDIIDQYGGTKAANTAHYYAGISYLNLGKFEAAISYLKDFKPAGLLTPAMRAGAIGDAYAELNDLDKALSHYKDAVSAAGKNDLIASYYLKKLGMLNEKLGNNDAAIAAYERIKKEFPNSSQAIDIDKYLYRLGYSK
ncbi:MAG: tetratricopeptide repeat protein [Lewinellaceae bacterium]|nr:tetratricopeptide repeat protein [Lewinella sp.]MCB9278145.1 tetratricopeptide repeat protein [Lewinellaceae bacterium]